MRPTRIIAISATAVLSIAALAWGQGTSNEKALIHGRYQLFASTVNLGAGARAAEQHM